MSDEFGIHSRCQSQRNYEFATHRFGIFGTAGIGRVCLSEHGSVLVLFDFLDQVHDPAPQLNIADAHERFCERQPVARCHEIRQWVRRRQPAGEGVARRRALEEEWDRHLQDMANLLQPARADPVGSLLAFWTC